MARAYLDNSATTRPCEAAVEAMVECMREGFYNPSSVYAPAVKQFKRIREVRENILKAVHGAGCEVYFTSGGTESNNLAIIGSVSKMYGRQIVAVSAVEHPSVREAFDYLAEQGHEVRVIGVNESGEPDWEALEAALSDGASLVSFMQVNNETGAKLDAEKLYSIVNGRALIHIDGVQGFMRVPFDMKYADMYTVSGHKIHGPKGIGGLIVKKNIRLAPRQIGGGQEMGVRSGTENTPGIAGLDAAVRRMQAMGPEMPEALMEKKLHLIEAFKKAVPDLLINGPDPEKAAPHIVNLSFPNVRGEVMLHALEAEGIFASTGSACSSKKLKVSSVLINMGIRPERAEWALRFSLSPDTTIEEIDYAAEKLGSIYDLLKRFRRR
ncbi:MAG: cysteine desulfurase [Clostridia bacterium]|nr:cysteine desulfurase [Clostridia bacterium]